MNILKITKILLITALMALIGFEAPISAAQRHKHGKSKKHAIRQIQSKKAQQAKRIKSRKPAPKINPRAKEQADLEKAKRLSLLEKAKGAIQPQKPAPAPAPALPVIPGANITNVAVAHQGANAECGYNALWNGVNKLKEVRGEEQPANRVQDITNWKTFIRERRAAIAQAEAAKAPKVPAKPVVAKTKPVGKGKAKLAKKPIKKVPAKPVKPAQPRPNDQWLNDGEIEELIRQFTDLQPDDYIVIKGMHQLNPNNEVGFENIADDIRALRADPNASIAIILGDMHYQIVPARVIQPAKRTPKKVGKQAKGMKKQAQKAAAAKALQEQTDTTKAEIRGIPGHWIAVVAQGDNYWVLDSGAPGRQNANAQQLIRLLRTANPDAFDFAADKQQLFDAVIRAFRGGNIDDGLTRLEQIINRAIQFQLFNPPLKQVIAGIINGTDDRLNDEARALLATAQENDDLTARINAIRASLANNQPIGGGIVAAAAARIKSALGLD